MKKIKEFKINYRKQYDQNKNVYCETINISKTTLNKLKHILQSEILLPKWNKDNYLTRLFLKKPFGKIENGYVFMNLTQKMFFNTYLKLKLNNNKNTCFYIIENINKLKELTKQEKIEYIEYAIENISIKKYFICVLIYGKLYEKEIDVYMNEDAKMKILFPEFYNFIVSNGKKYYKHYEFGDTWGYDDVTKEYKIIPITEKIRLLKTLKKELNKLN